MEETRIFDSEVSGIRYTIAIPTYKRSALLIEAVESALNQTYQDDYEVIVVDNNPERDDETEQVMSLFCSNPKVAYYKNVENYGMCGNWNQLYKLSKGGYVTMLHDDDMLYGTYLEIIDAFIQATSEHFDSIYPQYDIIRERISLESPSIPKGLLIKKIKGEDFTLGAIIGLPTGMTLKKSRLRIVGPFREDFYPIHDQDFAFRCACNANCCMVKMPLFMYYIGANESMNPNTVKMSLPQVDSFQKHTRKSMTLLWKLLSLTCRRANIISMYSWFSLFAPSNVIDESLSHVPNMSNKYLNYFSHKFRKKLEMFIDHIRLEKVVLK